MRCASSICRDCMVSTGVGIKCISCAEPRLHGQNTAGNRRRGSLLALAAVVALALCLIGLMLVFGNAEDGARSPSEAGERGAVARDIQIEGAGAVNLPPRLDCLTAQARARGSRRWSSSADSEQQPARP